jgi:hypothetical protein
MKINEAIKLLTTFESRTEKKSEIKIFQNMIGILLDLQNRQLLESELAAIEKELDGMELDTYQESRKRQLRRKLAKFQQFLNNKFSLVEKGHFTSLGIAFGVAFGVMFGAIFKDTLGGSLGLTFGIVGGLVIGMYLDKQAEAQNRVLNVELK